MDKELNEVETMEAMLQDNANLIVVQKNNLLKLKITERLLQRQILRTPGSKDSLGKVQQQISATNSMIVNLSKMQEDLQGIYNDKKNAV